MTTRANRLAPPPLRLRAAALAAAFAIASPLLATPPSVQGGAGSPTSPASENALPMSLAAHLAATRNLDRGDCVQPPDLLDFAAIGAPAADGRVELKIVVKPALDARVELSLIGPADLAFANGAKRMEVATARSAAPREERATMLVQNGRPTTAVLRATVYGENGEAWLWMDKVVAFNQPPPVSPDAPEALVPVVFERPDGSGRYVQRMTREQAKRYEGKAIQIGYVQHEKPGPKNETERAAAAANPEECELHDVHANLEAEAGK